MRNRLHTTVPPTPSVKALTVNPSAQHRGRARAAFTLIEILVVMAIIVLLIALALPAFNFITGSRSNEAAANQISAALSIARAQAVGLQKVAGVMFFLEPSSDRVQLALVQETDRPTSPDTDAAAVSTYLDLVPDTEFVKLPTGIGVQTVTNGLIVGGSTATVDRYVGFNTDGIASSGANANTSPSKIVTKVGGVILFDGNGQLTSRTYALRTRAIYLAPSGAPTPRENRMGALLYYDPDPTTADQNSANGTPADYIPATTLANSPVSQLGLVLYDANVFAGRGFTMADYRANATAAPQTGEAAEETWLDQNGTPTMINRYNGTLVRGE